MGQVGFGTGDSGADTVRWLFRSPLPAPCSYLSPSAFDQFPVSNSVPRDPRRGTE
jgi:hypothetical protein